MDLDWESGAPEGFYQEPSFPAQMAFNYNQLEGRFKQLQGEMRPGCGNALFTGVATLSRYDADSPTAAVIIHACNHM